MVPLGHSAGGKKSLHGSGVGEFVVAGKKSLYGLTSRRSRCDPGDGLPGVDYWSSLTVASVPVES